MSKSLQKSVFIVIVITLVTKLLGFLKQLVIAGVFGASSETDVFYLAFGLLTSFTYAVFSALSVTFIPIYQEEQYSDKYKAFQLVNRVLLTFLAFSIFIVFILIILSNHFASILLINSDNYDSGCVAYYIRLLSPLMVLSCITSVFGAVLEANKIFVFSKSSGITCSVFIISATLLLGDCLGVKALVYGTLAGYISQVFILVYACHDKIRAKLESPIIDDKIKKLFNLLLPLLVGNGIYEINKTIDKILSAGFSVGSTSALSYAQALFDSLCALTITSSVSVLFAYIAEQIVHKRYDDVIRQINNSVSMLLLFTAPIAIIIFINGECLISIVYGRGAFDINAIITTSTILKGYAVGLPFLIFREILAKVHYAFQDSATPMRNSLVAVVVNIFFSILLSKIIGVQGISYSTSISYALCACFMMITIKKHISYSVFSNGLFYSKLLSASILMIIADFLLCYLLSEGVFNSIFIICLSVVVYLLSLTLLKCTELNIIYITLRKIKDRRRNSEL